MAKCEVCCEEFQEGDLELHREVCVVRLVFRCSLCYEDFASKEAVWNHLDLHEIADESKESYYHETKTRDKLHQCVLCNDQRVYLESPYWKHIEDVHDGFFLQCSDCGESFRSEMDLNDHVLTQCQRRGPSVDSEEDQVIVKMEHTEYDAGHFNSEATERTNDEPTEISNAITSQILPLQFSCDVCGKSFPTKRSVVCHKNRGGKRCSELKSSNRVPDNKCSDCGIVFTDARKLSNHVLQIHKPFECNICGATFEGYNKIRYHQIKSHKDPKYDCSLCGRKFLLQNELDRHGCGGEQRVYRRYQTGKRQPRNLRQESSEEVIPCHQYSCQWCNYTSSSYRLFHYHTLTRHIEGKFKCPYCLSDFHFKSKLNMHLAGCKKLNLSCDLCGQKFNTARRLKYHMEKFHSDHAPSGDAIMEGVECNDDQRPDNVDKTGAVQETTVCSICETMFADVDELERHKQTCSVHEHKHVAQYNATEVQLVQSVGKSRRESTNESQIKLEFTAEESMLQEQKHLETPSNSFVASSMKSHTDSTYDCSLSPKEVVPEGGNTLSVEENVPNQKYSCHLCDFTSSTYHSFRYHWVTRHTEGKFKCRHCSRNFHYKRNFNDHVACCKKLSFSCDLCSQRFNMPSKLKHHMEQCHADQEACGDANMEGVECIEDQRPDDVGDTDVFQKTTVCIFCKTVFVNTEELMNHKQICAVHEQKQHDGHSNAGEVQLSQTAKKGQHEFTIVSQIKLEFTAEESRLQEHQSLEASMSSFVASVHSESSNSLETVAPKDEKGSSNSLETVAPKDEITVPKVKKTKGTSAEESTLPPISGPPWQCSICKMMFKGIRYLKYHRFIHHTEPRLKCSICSKGFHYPVDLHRHWKGCSKLRCSICNIKCATYANLKNHKCKSHQIQEDIVDEQQPAIMRPEMSCDPKKASKPVWSCSICNLEFDKYHLHRYHMTVSHTEPQYQCSLCHTKFHFNRNARHHEKGCLETRCHECGISFTRHRSLKKHNSSKHDSTANDTAASNQRGYDMNGLGDETNESKPLDCQSQTTACPESADKSFPCSICGRIFARQQLLDDHKPTCPTTSKAPENAHFSGSDIPLLPNVVESTMDKQTVPLSACVEKDIKARQSAKSTTKQSKGPKKRNKYDGIQTSLTAEVIESQTNRLIAPQRENVELKPDIVLEDTTLQYTDPDESFAASSSPCPKGNEEIESQTVRQNIPQGEDIEIKLEIKVENAIGQDT